MASGELVPVAAPCRLAVASYNVHRCIGADGHHAPARIAQVLRELDADVIGLQEVALWRGWTLNPDPALDRLATSGGKKAAPLPDMPLQTVSGQTLRLAIILSFRPKLRNL